MTARTAAGVTAGAIVTLLLLAMASATVGGANQIGSLALLALVVVALVAIGGRRGRFRHR